MTYDDVIQHYKTQVAVAEALGMDQSSVSEWKARNRVPLGRQIDLEQITGGKLRADLSTEKRRVLAKRAIA